ncbi:MAG: tyrosine-type recombinase/integrase [Dehalococcoidales bacterium]|jgi:site-specific recombinase XerD
MKGERYSTNTVFVYRYLAERYLRRDPKPTRLSIQAYLAERLDGGMSPSTVENERKALRSLFSFLKEEKLWKDDPTEKIRHIKVTWGERWCPEQAAVEKVLKVGFYRAIDAVKMRTITTLLATTGLRITEALSLRKDCIDYTHMELKIIGKGKKYRVVPLLPATADTLRDYIDSGNGSPYVFPGETREGYAHVSNIQKTLKRACIRAGVEPFTPHQLRHFYATESLRKGAKLEVIGRILGHSSIGITADIYRFVRVEELHTEHLKYAPKLGGAT